MNTPNQPIRIIDLGRMGYKPAWDFQKEHHAQLLADAALPPVLIFVEHDPVITLSQRKSSPSHLLTSRDDLTRRGIDIQPTDRGGDITYHGPGQLVAYPILRLASYQLNVGRYMRLLEDVVIDTLAVFNIQGEREEGHTGVWVQAVNEHAPAKICAMGVRVSRNITLHGLALNVTTRLAHFDAIVPCGLTDRAVTSMAKIMGKGVPSMDQVKEAMAGAFSRRLGCDRL
jgi:lipoyl(octanoyl) transferase